MSPTELQSIGELVRWAAAFAVLVPVVAAAAWYWLVR